MRQEGTVMYYPMEMQYIIVQIASMACLLSKQHGCHDRDIKKIYYPVKRWQLDDYGQCYKLHAAMDTIIIMVWPIHF